MQKNKKWPTAYHEIAEKIGLTSEHFNRFFTRPTGVGATKLAYRINSQYIQRSRSASPTPLFGDSKKTDHGKPQHANTHVEMSSMLPEEYPGGEKKCLISYHYEESLFGNVLTASTQKGICYVSFSDNEKIALSRLKKYFPEACFEETSNSVRHRKMRVYGHDEGPLKPIKLHLKGTAFQLEVWKALLTIPMGELVSYGTIAQKIQQPASAARAVGNAIGANPVALIIPCHRIITSTGLLGGYRWGKDRKAMIIGWELAQINKSIKK